MPLTQICRPHHRQFIAGIDPGLGGGLCILDAVQPTIGAMTYDIPTHLLERGRKVKREVDVHGLADLLRSQLIDHVFVEQAGAMPGQGVASMFAFGKVYGVILGVLGALGIPTTLVPPVVWKRTLCVPEGKHGARARASQLLPSVADQWRLAGQHGRAEAALIALYGARVALSNQQTNFQQKEPL